MNRFVAILYIFSTLIAACGDKPQSEQQTDGGFDITGVWRLVDRVSPEGKHYMHAWPSYKMYESDGMYFNYSLKGAEENAWVTPHETGHYSLSNDTLYIENGHEMPFSIVNDSTITIVWGKYTETLLRERNITEAHKEELRAIYRQAQRDKDGNIQRGEVYSTHEKKLMYTITKYHDIIIVLGVVVVLIIIYSIEVTRRKRCAENNLAAIKEDLRQRSAQQSDTIKQKGDTFFQSDYYRMIRQRIAAGENMSDDDWREMERQTDSVYTGFSRKLRSLHDFSDVEFQVCLLIKLRIPHKEIAAVIHRAPDSVSSIRSRLHKKILGPNGGAKEWDYFVLSL